MSDVPVFEVSDQCAKCQGVCCKRMGCHFSPTDFKEITFESLKQEIDKGFISIDWWENWGGPNEYYLRMRHVGSPVVDPSWGGRCILLTDTGCPLSFENRPLGARSLKPKETADGICAVFYSKEDCKNEWLQYEDILEDLVEYYRGAE